MLKVELKDFRCWKSLDLAIPMGGITLIKGGTGTGKTTLFQSIAWALYGSTAVRNVTPNNIDKPKTKVTINIDYGTIGKGINIKIERSKNPNRLIVIQNGGKYEDKVAQSIIDEKFGKYEVWAASCFINQKSFNTFLTAPNNGKMELLNSIAFHEEEPSLYIEKIEKRITEVNVEYKNKLELFNANLKILDSKIKSVDTKQGLTSDEKKFLEEDLSTKKQKLCKLQKIQTDRNIKLGILNKHQIQLEKLQINNIKINIPQDLKQLKNKYCNLNIIKYETVDHLDWPHDEILQDISEMETLINETSNVIPLLQRRDDLLQEINEIGRKKYSIKKILDKEKLGNENLECKHYTIEDYKNAVLSETMYNENERQAKKIGIPYTPESIQEKITECKLLLSKQDKIKKILTLRELEHKNTVLEEKIKNYSVSPLPEIIEANIIALNLEEYSTSKLSKDLNELSTKKGCLESHIKHLKLGQDVIKCPHCEGSVKYSQGKLFPFETSLPLNLSELSDKNNELVEIKQKIFSIENEIKNKKSAEIKATQLYQQKLNDEKKRIDRLKDLSMRIELQNQKSRLLYEANLEELSTIKENIEKLKAEIGDVDEIENVEHIALLTNLEIENQRNLISKLSTIKILEHPSVSSKHIQAVLDYQNYTSDEQTATNKYQTHLDIIPDTHKNENVGIAKDYLLQLTTFKNIVKKYYDEKEKIFALRSSLEEQILEIKSHIPENVDDDILKIKDDIVTIENKIKISNLVDDVLSFHSLVSNQREEAVSALQHLSDFQSLKQYAIDTECRILQQVVDSMNSSINDVCNNLFDKDISIKLSLFKTNKVTKNVKPLVNFTISYKGGIYDKIEQLSGGEGDRCSLALTLALNRLSSFPLLMLDETFSSLDSNMKECAIRTLEENTTNTVLLIMHDGIEGVFDNVIDLDTYN